VSGYYRDGRWVSAVVGGYRESAEETDRAVTEAIKRVEAGETTARHEMKELLSRYPSLKLDRENHPLKGLVPHYTREVLS